MSGPVRNLRPSGACAVSDVDHFFFEHARRQRQAARNVLALINYIIVIGLAIHRGVWDILAVMSAGIAMHLAVLATIRPLIGPMYIGKRLRS